uniref:WD repeat-containing protein 55 homolog n=2 Tax=Timema TaxID=61471 RepID=A0A7R8VIX6_TIMDO|nr:unnamed protein product [Timema douglasi]
MNMNTGTNSSDSDSDISITDSEDEEIENSDSKVDTAEGGLSAISSGNTAEGHDDAEDEDDLIKAIRHEKEKPRDQPPDILCEDFVVDISFHPSENIIAAATITGDVILHSYTNESTEIKETLELHTRACRDIEFNEDGDLLFSSSKDKCIMVTDTRTGKLKRMFNDAHENPLNCLCVMDNNIFASGDDSGTVKLWDMRKKDPIFSRKEMDDYVSKMVTTEAKRYLVCSSGEGTITSINLVSHKLHMQSEMYDAELTSLCLMRSDSKLLVGSSKGTMFLFNWGQFGYHSDEFPGVKQSINSMIPITENIVVTACEDGVLRATHLFPQRHLGVAGQHQFSVECLDISGDGTFIASSSHDQLIKFWNIRYFEEMNINSRVKSKKREEMKRNLPSSKFQDCSAFFSELA